MKGIEIIDWYDSEKYQEAVVKAINKLSIEFKLFGKI
jgi:hypothetical protein